MDTNEQSVLSGSARALLSGTRNFVIWLLGTIIVTTVVTKLIFGENPLGSHSSWLAKSLSYLSMWIFTPLGASITGTLTGVALSITFVQQLIKYDLIESRKSRRGVREVETIRTIADVIDVVAFPKIPDGGVDGLHYDEKSILSEGCATIASLIMRRFDKRPLNIMVTGAQPAEGKSTVALALGRSLARLNRATLLVDCDLRAPAQAAVHGHPQTPGFTDLVVGVSPAECIRKDPAGTGLSYIAAGHTPPSAPIILDMATEANIWGKLASHREFLVLDCPPVMSLADTIIVSGIADVIIMVIEADRTKLVDIKRTLNRVVPQGVPMFAVLNKVPKEWGDVFYGYGYSYATQPGLVYYGRNTSAPLLEVDTLPTE